MSFWANLFSSSKDRFSLDEMQRLHTVLLRNQVVTDGNRETVVETLRSIAELTIWGDQHDPSMVEYFLTENMLGHFHQILLQRSARRGTVAIQVLQTLSILIQNIRNQQTIYYLFSNDHINNIAALKFDFEDDEVLGYYVNLLKTISFRLNETTVQFFFRSGGGGSSGDGSTTPTSGPGTPSSTMLAASFPLYTEAVKFVAHRDGMVRAAVKTLTLNVFAIDLPSLRNFLSSPPADIFFDHLANYTVERCTALDRLLSSWDATAPRMAATVETSLAEIEDILTFCNDVFAVGVPSISSLLLGHLWRQVVGPVLFWPLLGEDTTPTDASSNGGGDGEASQKRLVGPLCSLYALERAIYAVTDPLLSSLLVSVLLGGPAEADAETLASSLQTIAGTGTTPATATATATTTMTASDLLKGLHADSKTYRASVLSMLRGGDAQLAAAVIRLLAAVLNRKSISEETIEAVGLLPRRRRKQRKLIEELTRDASSCDITTLPERNQINGTSSTTAVATAAEKEKDGEEEEDPFPQRSRSPSRIIGLRRYSPTDESVLQTLPESTTHQMNNTNNASNNNTTAKTNEATIASTVRGEEHFNEIIDSLLTALNLDLLPPLSIPVIGWALHRLLSSDAGPAELSSQQKNSLETAWKKRKDALEAMCAGSWGDTVVPMIVQIWGKVREIVLRIGPGPVHVAGHTWVQAVLLHELHWQLGGGGGGGSSKSTDSLINTAANTVAEEVAASNFAISAKVATIRVAACVAVAQIHAMLSTGQVPLQCFSTATSTAATILADVSSREIREGSVVPLPENESECMQCKVAFSRGVERIVMLCVLGFDQNQNKDADESTFSSPVVAILDPGAGSTLGCGTVLSIAPLLAAASAVDPDHPQWLHVHVRPQRSALLRLLSTGPSGAELAAMDQHLAEGHWVLAFADENSAKNAAEKVLQSASSLRQVHEKALEPLLEL